MESLAFAIFEMLVPWMQKVKKLKTGSVDSQITAFFCYIPVVSSRKWPLILNLRKQNCSHSPKSMGTLMISLGTKQQKQLLSKLTETSLK